MGMWGVQRLLADLAPFQKKMGNEVFVLELQSTPDRTLAKNGGGWDCCKDAIK